MNSARIYQIQQLTAYAESYSVTMALNQVWNEVQQEADAKIATARADAYREGMVAAAGIENSLREMLALWGRVHGTAIIGRPTVNAARKALAAASEPAKVPEVCEWGPLVDNEWRSLGCEKGRASFMGNYMPDECPYCGKAISVREG